jgi:hypothetical protein
MTPFTRTLLLGLPLALAGGLQLGNLTVNSAHTIADAQIARTTLPEPLPTENYTVWHNTFHIEAYEDGSGWLYEGDNKIYQFDSDMLPWDCTNNGNADCGPDAPAEVRGFKCTEFFYPRDDAVIQYCTDGTTRDRAGDDVDAEGETIG